MKSSMSIRKRIGLLLTSPVTYKAQLLDEMLRMPGLLVVVTNTRFELVMANEYFYTYFDCEPAMLIGKSLYSFLSDDVSNDINESHIQQIISEGHLWDHDVHTARPDGETVLIRWNHGIIFDANRQPGILSVGVPQPPKTAEEFPDSVSEYAPRQYEYNRLTISSFDDPPAGSRVPVGFSVTEAELQHAMENDEIALYYQPTVSVRSKKIAGAEALLRFNHPRYGILNPGAFIPKAEETGQIIPMGEYVIGAACKKIKRWNASGLDMFLSINISTQQFMHPSFAETLLHGITRHDVAAGRLLLEITEDTASRDPVKVQSILETLRNMGCRISLDDFGTSFTSLHYLEKLDIDNLKIDRAFLANASRNKKSFAIMSSIIVLAHGLGISVSAEGVETQDQLSFLVDNACDYLQGYLLSHPLPENDFDRLVNDNPGFYARKL